MLEASGIQESVLRAQDNEIKNLTSDSLSGKKDKELMNAATQFESVFVNQLFKALDATIERDKEGMFSGGNGEEMFRSMYHQELANNIASDPATSFGFAKQIYEQMKNAI